MRLGIQENSCYITKEPSGKASFVHSSTQVEKYGSISIQWKMTHSPCCLLNPLITVKAAITM